MVGRRVKHIFHQKKKDTNKANPILAYPMHTIFHWLALGPPVFALGLPGFALGLQRFALGVRGFVFVARGVLDTNMLVSPPRNARVGGIAQCCGI